MNLTCLNSVQPDCVPSAAALPPLLSPVPSVRLACPTSVLLGPLGDHQQRNGARTAGGAERACGCGDLLRAGHLANFFLGAVRLLHRRQPLFPLRLPPSILRSLLDEHSRCLHGVEQHKRFVEPS